MNVRDEKKIASFRKRLKCNTLDCGNFITFSTTEHNESINFYDRWYKGKCASCGNKIKIKAADINLFNSHFGQATIKMTSSTFNKLFDLE